MIINAFHDTYSEMTQNLRMPKLTDTQIQQLLRFVNRNKSGFLSYKELLIQTFGPIKGEKLFLTDKRQLEEEAQAANKPQSSRFVMP